MKKLHLTTHLMSCAAFVLSPLAAQELPAPEVSAYAYAGDNDSTMPDKENTAKAAAGTVSADAVLGLNNLSTTSSSQAKAGTLTGRVKCVDSEAEQFGARGRTSSFWRDTMTINAPGRTGQEGIVTMNFKVKGISTFQANDGNAGTEVRTIVNVDTLGGIQEFRRSTSTTPSGSFGDEYLGQLQSFDFGFTYGKPFSVNVLLAAEAFTSGSFLGVGLSEINAEWDWHGFSNFRDADGVKKVLSATVKSESNTNYLRPIGVIFPTVTIRSNLSQLTEKPAQTGTITISLNKPATTGLSIDLGYTGNATFNSDYTTGKPTNVFIPKGATQATFSIRTVNDALIEAPEKISIRLLPGAGYAIGLAKTADVTILSDE